MKPAYIFSMANIRKKRCKNCGCCFAPSPRHPNQKYCAKDKCQKARKAKWQSDKLANDEFYRQNQKDCQKRWSKKNPDYWNNYRKKNPDYAEQNRVKQRERNQIGRIQDASASISKPIAKMDVNNSENAIISGIYKLIPCNRAKIANMDAIIVEIHTIPDGYIPNDVDCKDRTLFPSTS